MSASITEKLTSAVLEILKLAVRVDTMSMGATVSADGVAVSVEVDKASGGSIAIVLGVAQPTESPMFRTTTNGAEWNFGEFEDDIGAWRRKCRDDIISMIEGYLPKTSTGGPVN